MDKYQTKNVSKGIKYFVVFSVIVFLVMYVYGMANTYFPEPINIGRGHYLDISSGIIIVGMLLFGLVLAIFFKREMRKISNLKRI